MAPVDPVTQQTAPAMPGLQRGREPGAVPLRMIRLAPAAQAVTAAATVEGQQVTAKEAKSQHRRTLLLCQAHRKTLRLLSAQAQQPEPC